MREGLLYPDNEKLAYPMIAPSQVLKHSILTPLSCFSINNQRLKREKRQDRNYRVWNESCKFMRSTARISEIDNNEACEVS